MVSIFLPQAFCLQAVKKLYHPIDDRLRARWTARDKYIHRQNFFDPAGNVIAPVEDSTRGAARTDRHHEFRVRHLFVGSQQALARLARDRAGADQDIRMARGTLQLDPETLQVIDRGEGG